MYSIGVISISLRMLKPTDYYINKNMTRVNMYRNCNFYSSLSQTNDIKICPVTFHIEEPSKLELSSPMSRI